jgi:hypothetical protein
MPVNRNFGYRGTSFNEQAIFFYIKQLFPDVKSRFVIKGVEVDIFLPKHGVCIEYDGVYFHYDRVHKDLEKNIVLGGYTTIRIREDGLDALDGCYNILTSGKKSDLSRVLTCILEVLSFKGILPSCSVDVDIKRDAVSIMTQISLQELERSLSQAHPEIAKEWDYSKNGNLTPAVVSRGSTLSVYWVCENGHEFIASVASRTGKYSVDCNRCVKKFSVYSKLILDGDLVGARFIYGKRYADVSLEVLKSNNIDLDLSTVREDVVIQVGSSFLTEEELTQNIHVTDYSDSRLFLRRIKRTETHRIAFAQVIEQLEVRSIAINRIMEEQKVREQIMKYADVRNRGVDLAKEFFTPEEFAVLVKRKVCTLNAWAYKGKLVPFKDSNNRNIYTVEHYKQVMGFDLPQPKQGDDVMMF